MCVFNVLSLFSFFAWQEMGKEVWGFQENVIAFLNEELIGGQEEFSKWAMDNHGYRYFRSAVKTVFKFLWYMLFIVVGFLNSCEIQAVTCTLLVNHMYYKGQKGQIFTKLVHLIHVKREMKWKLREIWGVYVFLWPKP